MKEPLVVTTFRIALAQTYGPDFICKADSLRQLLDHIDAQNKQITELLDIFSTRGASDWEKGIK